MSRKNREKSPNGVYHVMIRGINKQDIFVDDADYRIFIKILKDNIFIQKEFFKDAKIQSFRLFSYCLMTNHVHLLIQEVDEPLALSMKRICTRYAIYFNMKYMRVGHLFQDRFRSEPCNDANYFFTLVRYIHQNPVKAGICQTAEQHPWNSWNEIRCAAGQPVSVPVAGICDKEMLFRITDFADLDNMVHAPVPDKDNCIDIDNVRVRIKDDTVRCILVEVCGTDNPSDLSAVDAELQSQAVVRCLSEGASINQLSRITGINRRILNRLAVR